MEFELGRAKFQSYLNLDYISTLYQGRPQRRQLNPHEVKVKAESKIMEVKEIIASSGSNYDSERADQLAISIDGNDDSNRERYFPSKKFDHIRLKGQEMATRGSYYAAIVRNGKLILFPVKSTYQLRPQLGYMDRATKKNNELKNTESTDEEEEVKAVNVKVNLKKNLLLKKSAIINDESSFF